jgi:glycosyltransferase involved in cell wall biosynthesis
MHVLILAQYFPPDMGGSSTRAYNVAKGLTMNNVDVTVITSFPHYPDGNIHRKYQGKPFTKEKKGKINIIRTFIFPIETKGFLRRVFLFANFILSSLMGVFFIKKVDVIWAANPDIFCLVPSLIFRARYSSPIIFNVDDLSLQDINQLQLAGSESLMIRIARIMSSFLYKQANAITPISPGYYKAIIEFGVNPNNIHLLLGGVDLDVFLPKRDSPQVFIVLYSGSFSVAYDFDQIILAAKILESSHPNIKFIIQGKGELAPRIIRQIDHQNLLNIEVKEELLDRSEVSTLLNSSSILLLPLADFGSPYLGISSKLYEYQAVEKPIICIAEGMPSRYIQKTKSGLVVKPGDYRAIAQAIIYLHDNPSKALEMAINGRSFVEKNISLKKIGTRMKDIMKRVI